VGTADIFSIDDSCGGSSGGGGSSNIVVPLTALIITLIEKLDSFIHNLYAKHRMHIHSRALFVTSHYTTRHAVTIPY